MHDAFSTAAGGDISRILKQGGVIILPTDTVYGIAAALSSPQGIRRLYQLKSRPLSQATALLIASPDDIPAVSRTEFSPQVSRLMADHWPGDLTVLVTRLADSAFGEGLDLICGGSDRVGLRLPDHALVREVIRAIGCPLVASSANRKGAPAPYQREDLDPELVAEVDALLPGSCGSGVSSTVIDLISDPPRLMREGDLTRDMLTGYFPVLG